MTGSPLARQAEEQFLRALQLCGQRYAEHTYYRERDLVYTIQLELVGYSLDPQLPACLQRLQVPAQAPRPLNSDLVVMDTAAPTPLLLAVEFKYEPDRRRTDITPGKIPVTAWPEIQHDLARVQSFLDLGGAEIAYAALVDEDGRYAELAPAAFNRGCSG